MTGLVHVESRGSHWFFYQESSTYVRAPKGEGPRFSPRVAGPLQDMVPHAYLCWWLSNIDQLRIIVPDSDGYGIRTPPGAVVRSGEREPGLINTDEDWVEWYQNRGQ